ncbi:DNA-binding response regulator, LuxR family [Pseudonocardia sp. Ae168_Ps1]|nr:DNA-binding response regulator, LuxR family [Pseudonocardia sp. Ae150A_Ps1]OLL78523.1 DNA-binding response regulator, LuxR family [Pseudonocardia sp. Ae168_Ps1]OLL87352.1 DNA-binding response regulator, LuxR family [Pseudonocardia sp. Ae263_Ps1]OLL92619.1 DNA-binding response regulator, LuxR family [Pseudonocardia sp. Ae356_Ps1]
MRTCVVKGTGTLFTCPFRAACQDVPMTVRVVVADDQAVVPAGLRTVLAAAPDIEVVGEASDGGAAAELVESLTPDVVLMDVRMPGTDGIEGTRRIRALRDPGIRVLVVTTFDLDRHVYDALRAGASGFVLKDVEPEDLQVAVRTVHAGHELFAPSVTRRLVGSFVPADPEPGAGPAGALTERERQVLGLVAAGLSNAEIAARLVLGGTTVKTHVSNLLTKLDLRDRVQLVVFAYEHGLVGAAGDDG